MYLLYLDDSGSVSNKSEDYFVLGGLCVPENSVGWLSSEMESLAEEIDPDNPRSVEFHAASIFSGRDGVWQTFRKREDRIRIIKRVLFVLDKSSPGSVAVFACAVHKESTQGDPVQIAFEQLSSRFDIYVRRQNTERGERQKGIIILDKSSYETSLQHLANHFKQEGTRWGNRLSTLSEVPLFIDSKASRIIQLTDHIAYAVFRRYNAADLTYFNCIEKHFDQSAGVMHGLVHWQLYNRNCTCPACVTRRLSKNTW
jgi:hypothetical protein